MTAERERERRRERTEYKNIHEIAKCILLWRTSTAVPSHLHYTSNAILMYPQRPSGQLSGNGSYMQSERNKLIDWLIALSLQCNREGMISSELDSVVTSPQQHKCPVDGKMFSRGGFLPQMSTAAQGIKIAAKMLSNTMTMHSAPLVSVLSRRQRSCTPDIPQKVENV